MNQFKKVIQRGTALAVVLTCLGFAPATSQEPPAQPPESGCSYQPTNNKVFHQNPTHEGTLLSGGWLCIGNPLDC